MLGHPCQKADLGEGCRKQHMLQNYTDAIKSEQTPSRNLGPHVRYYAMYY